MESSKTPFPNLPTFSLSVAAAFLLLAINFWMIGQNEIPIWLQPACVGALWGCTFFAGFAAKGAIFKGTWLGILLGATFVWTSNLALARITDIPAPECLVILTLIVAFGWVIASRDSKSSANAAGGSDGLLRLGNYSIMDIAVLTLVVACLVQAVPRLTVHPLFFFALMVSMIMGVCASWLVTRWVFYDRWTPGMLYWMLVPVVMGAVVCVMLAPKGQEIHQILGWMISGPIAVVTSQAVVVMLMLAVNRFERAANPVLGA